MTKTTTVTKTTVEKETTLDEPTMIPLEADVIPQEADVVKNVDGPARQRKGSSRFSKRQSTSRSNRSSVGSLEEHLVDAERTSPDLTSRLVETNSQLQRLDNTFTTACHEVLEVVGGATEEAGGRGEQGHQG